MLGPKELDQPFQPRRPRPTARRYRGRRTPREAVIGTPALLKQSYIIPEKGRIVNMEKANGDT